MAMMSAPLFGTPLNNPDDLARKRKIAEALMSVQPNPTNLWQGIQSAIGQIGGSVQETSLDQAEKAAQAGYGREYAGLGDNPTRSQLEAVAGDPWGNSGQQAVVNALLSQNVQQSDPTTQADLALKQEQLKQDEFDMNKPVSVGRGWGQPDILVDPHTFKPVYDPLAGQDNGTPGALPAGTTGSAEIDTTADGYATKIVPGSGGLTQAVIDQGALAASTTGQFPTGRTGPALQQSTAIRNRAGEMSAGANFAANKAQLSTLTSALRQQQEYLSTVTRSTANADAGLQQLLTAFNGKVNLSQFPSVNAAANAIKAQLDPGTISAYQAGLQEVANEYAQVFSRGGQVTDAVRTRAASIANGDLGLPQLQQVLNEIQSQSAIVVKGAQDQVSSLSQQIKDIGGGKSASTSAPPSTDYGTPVPGFDNTFIKAMP